MVESGVGYVHFVDRRETMDASLLAMRRAILDTRPVAAVFVGGMSGLFEEHEMVGDVLPDALRIPVKGPGGAAAKLPTSDAGLPVELADLLDSREYPFLASVLIEVLGRSCAPAVRG